MKKNRRRHIAVILSRNFAILILLLAVLRPVSAKAATKVEFDDTWEDLYVETSSLDSIFDQPYAKLTTSVKDIEDYYLNITSEDLIESFSKALDKSNVSYTEDTIAPFKVSLIQYLYDSDEDEKQIYNPVTVYIPLPTDAQEHATDCSLYKISGSTATFVKAPLCIDEYDVYYIQMTFSKQSDYSTLYGYVFNSPDDYNDEESDDDDEYDDEDNEYEDDYDDEDTDEFDLPEDEIPEGGPGGSQFNDPDIEDDYDIELEDDLINEFDLPEDESLADDEDDDDIEAIPIPTATPSKDTASTASTPTKTPEQTGGAASGNSSASDSMIKDHIPKTGDDFPYYELIVTSILASVIIIITLIKKKH